MLIPLLLILLLILLLGALPIYPYNRAWDYGYYPSGVLSVLMLALLILWLLGWLRVP